MWAAPGYGDPDRLREHAREKHFHYALVPTRHTRRYCYATLAWKHFNKISPKGAETLTTPKIAATSAEMVRKKTTPPPAP